MIICGIDEAGRGPVIGPLVLAGVIMEEQDLPQLDAMGVKDSKLLTIQKRDELFDEVKKVVKKYAILISPPAEVDMAVNGIDNLNLNKLEAIKTAQAINELKPDKAIVDAPSINIAAYNQFLESKLSVKTQLITEHKADLNHTIVGAASILAKVTRDREIEKLKQEIGIDFGSGYPSDPKTKHFLEHHYKEYPDILRKSWASYKNVAEKKFQKGLDAFVEKKDNPKKEKLLQFTNQGYAITQPKTAYEDLRLTGPVTIILYSTGKILVQGKKGEKEKVEKIIAEMF